MSVFCSSNASPGKPQCISGCLVAIHSERLPGPGSRVGLEGCYDPRQCLGVDVGADPHDTAIFQLDLDPTRYY